LAQFQGVAALPDPPPARERILKIVMEYSLSFATFARPQRDIEIPAEALKIEV